MSAFTVLLLLSILATSQLHEPCYYHPNISLPIPLAQHQIAYFKDENIVYSFGGKTSDSSTNAIYKWNVSDPDGSFTMISQVTPTPNFYSSINNVVVIGNNAYFIGVHDGSYTSGLIHIFNIEQESFIDNSNYAVAIHKVSFGCLTTNNSHIFMVSGYNGGMAMLESSYTDYLQIYELNTNQWIEIEIPFLTGWTDQYCAMVDNTLFVMGGWMPTSQTNEMHKWHWKNGWNAINTKPEKSRQGTVSYYNSFMYLIGGGYPAKNTIDVFHTESETIINTYYMLDSLYYLSSLIMYAKLYIFGGRPNSTYISSAIQICDLTTITPTRNPTNIPTVNPTPIPSYIPTSIPTQQPTIQPTNTPSEIPTKAPSDNPNLNNNDDGTYFERYFTRFTWIVLGVGITATCCCVCCLLMIIIMYHRKLKRVKLRKEMKKSNDYGVSGCEMVEENQEKKDENNVEDDDSDDMFVRQQTIGDSKHSEGQEMYKHDRVSFKNAESTDSAISAYQYGMVIKTPKPKSLDQLEVIQDDTELNRMASNESMYAQPVVNDGLNATPTPTPDTLGDV